MNEPVGQARQYLKIQGDPTPWGLSTAPPSDFLNTGPVTIPIVYPVVGSLFLSPAQVGSVVLTGEIDFVPMDGWMNGTPIELLTPYLYIPNPLGLSSRSLEYPLQSTSLADLQVSILDVMRTGNTVTVPVDALGGGTVILNGARLPFAVLIETQTN